MYTSVCVYTGVCVYTLVSVYIGVCVYICCVCVCVCVHWGCVCESQRERDQNYNLKITRCTQKNSGAGGVCADTGGQRTALRETGQRSVREHSLHQGRREEGMQLKEESRKTHKPVQERSGWSLRRRQKL